MFSRNGRRVRLERSTRSSYQLKTELREFSRIDDRSANRVRISEPWLNDG
jgi:hypothetical protein